MTGGAVADGYPVSHLRELSPEVVSVIQNLPGDERFVEPKVSLLLVALGAKPAVLHGGYGYTPEIQEAYDHAAESMGLYVMQAPMALNGKFWPRSVIGTTESSARSAYEALESGDEVALGVALGYPRTGAEAYADPSRPAVSLSQYPPEHIPNDISAFAHFMVEMSETGINEGVRVATFWRDAVKRVSPILYEETVRIEARTRGN